MQLSIITSIEDDNIIKEYLISLGCELYNNGVISINIVPMELTKKIMTPVDKITYSIEWLLCLRKNEKIRIGRFYLASPGKSEDDMILRQLYLKIKRFISVNMELSKEKRIYYSKVMNSSCMENATWI